MRNLADVNKASYLIYPREGWAMGMGAALLWLIISFICCCKPILLSQAFLRTLRSDV